MKTLIVYLSKTGFTKRYAEWIGEELKCKTLALKDAMKQNLTQYDEIIYGGWVMGSMISGLERIRARYSGKIVVFSCGITPPSDEVTKKLTEVNKLEGVPLFYFPGGLDRSKLGFVMRKMFEMGAKAQAKDGGDFPFDKDFDNTDRKYIEPLLNSVSQNQK